MFLQSLDVAETARALAAQAARAAPKDAEGVNRLDAHVGHFLLGQGRSMLVRACVPGARPTWGETLRSLDERTLLLGYYALAFMMAAGLTWAVATFWRLDDGRAFVAVGVGCLLFLLSFEVVTTMFEAAVQWFLPRRETLAMDFAGEVPEAASTLVCVPTLLTSADRVVELVRDLEARWAVEAGEEIRLCTC